MDEEQAKRLIDHAAHAFAMALAAPRVLGPGPAELIGDALTGGHFAEGLGVGHGLLEIADAIARLGDVLETDALGIGDIAIAIDRLTDVLESK